MRASTANQKTLAEQNLHLTGSTGTEFTRGTCPSTNLNT